MRTFFPRIPTKEKLTMILRDLPVRFPPVALLLISILTGSGLAGQAQTSTLFKLLPPSVTGVRFTNKITESDSFNILRQANIYNGGGVGIGDFNHDGLVDIYFTGNMVSNKLYLNKGGLKFEDITEKSGISCTNLDATGVALGITQIVFTTSCPSHEMDESTRTLAGKKLVPIIKQS